MATRTRAVSFDTGSRKIFTGVTTTAGTVPAANILKSGTALVKTLSLPSNSYVVAATNLKNGIVFAQGRVYITRITAQITSPGTKGSYNIPIYVGTDFATAGAARVQLTVQNVAGGNQTSNAGVDVPAGQMVFVSVLPVGLSTAAKGLTITFNYYLA